MLFTFLIIVCLYKDLDVLTTVHLSFILCRDEQDCKVMTSIAKDVAASLKHPVCLYPSPHSPHVLSCNTSLVSSALD